jgi:polyhydroxyalkanoate synthesis regulator phasin
MNAPAKKATKRIRLPARYRRHGRLWLALTDVSRALSKRPEYLYGLLSSALRDLEASGDLIMISGRRCISLQALYDQCDIGTKATAEWRNQLQRQIAPVLARPAGEDSETSSLEERVAHLEEQVARLINGLRRAT